MLKKKMEVDAVDMAYTFGLEQRFNLQSILVSFLRESKETWKKSRKGVNGSSATQVSNIFQWVISKNSLEFVNYFPG